MIAKEIARTSRTDITTTTTIEFEFPDGAKLEVDIAHFNPADEDTIQQGVANRYVSELRNHAEVQGTPELAQALADAEAAVAVEG